MGNPASNLPGNDSEQATRFPRPARDAATIQLLAWIHGDMGRRWRAGDRVPVESYLYPYPALGSDDAILLELVYAEIALRMELGEAPGLDEFLLRFPRFKEQLAALTEPAADGSGQQTLTIKRPAELPDATAPDRPSRELPAGADHLSAAYQGGERFQVAGYEVLEELGRGGMGVVYKARQISLNRLVALKVLRDQCFADPNDLRRFRREAETLARLQHANIVQVYEVGESQGRPYCLLELVEGGSLDRVLVGSPQPPRTAAQFIEVLARAIHVAHQAGIVHRDLKPANVLMQMTDSRLQMADCPDKSVILNLQSAIPKITDFGIAKLLEETDGETQTGIILGTPSYMAPEQAGRSREVGPPCDVYALGAVLYEMLTGRPPFKGVNPLETVAQVLSDEPVPPRRLQPRVPRDLETICLKCLQKDPRKRYPTALELADDLARFLAQEPIRARPMARTERMWRWCRRNPVPASLLLAITLGAAIGMWYLSQLSESLVRFSALEGAAQQSEMFDEVNNFYSGQIVDSVTKAHIEVTHFYREKDRIAVAAASTVGLLGPPLGAGPMPAASALYPGRIKAGAIPTPATFTIELGDQISNHSQRGMHLRLYSDLPFRSRLYGGPHDAFERQALQHLRTNPDEPYFRFEDYLGQPVLRYATARRMKQSCVNCHNRHRDSPRTDWEVGEVRGVLEIIRPLDRDVARAQEGLSDSFRYAGGIFSGLLLLSGVILVVSNRRRRAAGTP